MLRRFACPAKTIRLVVYGLAAVGGRVHRTVALVVVDLGDRTVNRQLIVVRPYPVTVGIGVSEQAALQHFVRGSLNTRYE
ncbi:hypothetical protein D3C73_1245010 [compost metagenome]